MSDLKKRPALLMKIESLHDTFGKAERKVADYICEHPDEVIYFSVAELAKASGVSDATVVRACHTMGLDGYQDLKVTLAGDIVTPLQSVHEEIKPDDSSSVIVDKVFQGILHTLTFTHDTLKVSVLETASELIYNARNIAIFGVGNSHSITIDFQHKLLRLGLHATAYSDSHLQILASTFLTEEDVVIAISHSGSSIDIVDAVTVARKNGAKIIALTNLGSSPLSKLADVHLTTASKETKYRIVALNSRISQIAILDSIYTLIAVRHPNTIDGFHRFENNLKHKKY